MPLEADMQEWKVWFEWIEFAGKVLVFTSFWFAAPEIAGEQRLKNISKATLSTIAMLVGFLGWLVTLFLISVLLGVALPASVNPLVNPPVQEGLLSPPTNPLVREVRLGFGLIVMVLAVGAAKLTRGWFEERVLRPWVMRLAESDSLRSVWLRIGVILFVVGSVFDMGWWLWDKKIGKLLGVA